MSDTYMKEAKRWPGSEWLKNRPARMEAFDDGTVAAVNGLYPVMKRVSPAPRSLC